MSPRFQGAWAARNWRVHLLALAILVTCWVRPASAQTLLDRFVDEYVKNTAPAQPEQPRAKPIADKIVGRWLAGGNTEWQFLANGAFVITGTRNKGEWKRTPEGLALRYAGATVWINLRFVGDLLVDQDGFIGRAQLKKIGN